MAWWELYRFTDAVLGAPTLGGRAHSSRRDQGCPQPLDLSRLGKPRSWIIEPGWGREVSRLTGSACVLSHPITYRDGAGGRRSRRPRASTASCRCPAAKQRRLIGLASLGVGSLASCTAPVAHLFGVRPAFLYWVPPSLAPLRGQSCWLRGYGYANRNLMHALVEVSSTPLGHEVLGTSLWFSVLDRFI